MSFKLESVKVHNVMEKDIIFIYFWPDAEALRINLWNILQKEKRGRKKSFIVFKWNQILFLDTLSLWAVIRERSKSLNFNHSFTGYNVLYVCDKNEVELNVTIICKFI